jgi:O-succinylbenzoic acid--CoA ligase
MTRPVRIVDVAGEPQDAARVGEALEQALDPGAREALAVLPVQPQPWRERLAAAVQPRRPVPDPVALVVPTSGSTGAPAGVLLSATALAHAADAVVERLGGPGAWLLALPLTHMAGLMVLVRALRTSRPVVAVDTHAGFRPQPWAEAVAALPPGRAYASLVPTQLARLLEADPEPLRRLDAVLLGGAAAPSGLLRRAAEQGVRVVASYGMTETCGGCVLDGRPLPGVQVSTGAHGRLSVAGPTVAWGVRRGGVDTPLHGRLTTHDVGYWEDGRLRLRGRVDDVVNSGGVSVPLATVEALLHDHPDVREAAAVPVADPVWGVRVVAVAVARDPARPPEDLRAFVHERAEPAFVPATVVWVDALPRPVPGKVDRAALRALVADLQAQGRA